MSKKYYLECESGVAGDMLVGALLDMGADAHKLMDVLRSLPLGGYEVRIGRVRKAGIDACDFDVVLDPAFDGHDHDMEYLHGRGRGREHAHPHVHRGLMDVYDIIDAGVMPERARQLAKTIFYVVAQSEARAHAMPVEEVHFHEVGAVDSIVDIVSIAVCVDDLGIEELIVPYICEGRGSIRCAHGILPIPVPAVMAIAGLHDIPLKRIDAEGEFVTPTGAAAVAALRSEEPLPEMYTVKRMGLGAGKRNYERASILRLFEIEPRERAAAQEALAAGQQGKAQDAPAAVQQGKAQDAPAAGQQENAQDAPAAVQQEKAQDAPAAVQQGKAQDAPAAGTDDTADVIWKLETDLDDITGEQLGYVMDLLYKSGAREVHFTPIQMKKNRPGVELVVICDEIHCSWLEEVLFTETTTIGIRKQKMERRILPRRSSKAHTAFGKVKVKEVTLPDQSVRLYPEYDEVIALARQKRISYYKAWSEVMKAILRDG